MNKVIIEKSEIQFLLKFYLKEAWKKSGNRWTDSNSEEIDNIVEHIDNLVKLRVREMLGNDKSIRNKIGKS